LFAAADGSPAQNIACWNGTSWRPLGSGLNNAATALASFGHDLYAGGWFTAAGGRQSARFARWRGTAVPVVVSDLEVARSAEQVVLRWRIDPESIAGIRSVQVERAITADGLFSARTGDGLAPATTMEFGEPLVASERYWYRVVLSGLDGTRLVAGPVWAGAIAPAPTALTGAGVTPAGALRFTYTVAAPGAMVEWAVYDVRGRTLTLQRPTWHVPGEYVRTWPDEMTAGHAPRGVYFVRLSAPGIVATRKFSLAVR
jgi:hypothetical protein